VVRNDSDNAAEVTLVSRIEDPKGDDAGMSRSPVSVPAWGQATVTQVVAVAHPQLWDPASPVLYRVVSEVHAGELVTDSYQTPFGIRTIAFDVNRGFLLNGKRFVIKGVCLHADLGALGAAAYEAEIERRLKILMSMGVNAVRLSHNPYSPEMLAICDRLGLIVFDESFDKWYGFQPDGTGWKDDLTSFVERDRNHPSVVIWSVGNEMTPHMYMHFGTRLFQSMSAAVHQLDPTRPVTAALHPVRNSKGQRDAPLAELAQYMDVISMNYQTRFYARDHGQHPNQMLLGSETHLHQVELDDPRQPNDGSGNQWFGTRDYRTNQYYPYVVGQFTWAGFDYLGEAGAWPSKGNRRNLIEMTGFRKPFSYYEQSLYTDTPMVAIAVANPDFRENRRKYDNVDWLSLASHWNWPATLPTLRVYTFTNATSVELRLNGKSLGEKRTADSPNRIIAWEVPNQPGTLEAIAKNNGVQVATYTLKTAGKATHLVLIPDRTRIDASGEDLANIEVRLEDANGIVVPDDASEVQFSISGAGKIAAVDNGDLDSPESFHANQRQTRQGRCLVIVQSARQPGAIQVTAHVDGLPEATVNIDSQAVAGPATLP